MRLSELVAGIGDAEQIGADAEVTAVRVDSREVTAGSLFVAVPGFASDGHRYVQAALSQGAAALLLQRDHVDRRGLPAVPLVLVGDTRAALAAVSAAFYGHPAGRMRVIGVTGTDGKTTTSYLINAVIEGAGRRTGLLGTVDFKIAETWQSNTTRLTTPGATEVQALLAAMTAAGVEYAILESTSHGLELRRLDHCQYDVAVFTNLTPDHLDQHGTMAAYRDAKGRLFEMLGEPSAKRGQRYAVLNLDDPEFSYFRDRSAARVVTYGFAAGADVRAEDVEADASGTKLRIQSSAGSFRVELPLPGLFNVSNALAAVALGIEEGIATEAIARSLATFAGVPGRMERIDCGQPFGVIVDYAHTGEALRKVLNTLRPATRGRIIALFGSAGERGHTRRSGMASAAAELAGYTVLTDEDPRSEDPMAIIDEMAETLRAAGRSEPQDYLRVLDRQNAIRAAMRLAKPGDLVLLAGKGHEQSIEARGQKLPWDDRAAARRALMELGYRHRDQSHNRIGKWRAIS